MPTRHHHTTAHRPHLVINQTSVPVLDDEFDVVESEMEMDIDSPFGVHHASNPPHEEESVEEELLLVKYAALR